MKNGIEKIEKNTEYTILLHGKWEKFAFYSVKENGRLCLLNTKYGTLTSMNASYFLKLISGKFPFATRPYKVEYPEDVQDRQEITQKQSIDIYEKHRVAERAAEEKAEKELKQWIIRLKSLPLNVEETLEKDLKVAPRTIAENLDKWNKKQYSGSVIELMGEFNRVKGLLKGTEWFVK